MDILFHVKCMFPKDKLFNFGKSNNRIIALNSSRHDNIDDIMRETLDTLLKNGIAKPDIQISTVNNPISREIFVTLLDNINVFRIAKMLGLEKPLRNNKLSTTNLGDRYFVVSFDAIMAGA